MTQRLNLANGAASIRFRPSLHQRVVWVAAVVTALSCQDAPPRDVGAEWVPLHATEATRSIGGTSVKAPRDVAVQAFRRAPSPATEAGLVRGYFPEFQNALANGKGGRVFNRVAGQRLTLQVAPEGGAIELTTRGHSFRIQPRSGVPAMLSASSDRAFAGEHHFFAPIDQLAAGASQWRTSRVEEYWIREAATGFHESEYTVALPQGVHRIRDAGDTLEFLDEQEVPVLRFHASVVRDAEGRSRTGTLRLADAGLAGPGLYLASASVRVASDVSLEGLTPPLVVDPGWSSTTSLATPRTRHTATLLSSGKILVAGGSDGSSLASAEIYDLLSNSWSASGALVAARSHHTATLLSDGKVLVVGGRGEAGVLGSAELFDPASGTWAPAASLTTPRAEHQAVLLPSGKLLVVGGTGEAGELASAELFDPATNTWSSAGALAVARTQHTATLLPSGQVLVVGGRGAGGALASTEAYDSASNEWRAGATLSSGRSGHTATVLPSGDVLVVGGEDDRGSVAFAERFDASLGRWVSAAALPLAVTGHTAIALPGGELVVAGGFTSGATPTDATQRLAHDAWTKAARLSLARAGHTATLLPSGDVLLAGGENGAPLSDTELFVSIGAENGAAATGLSCPSDVTAEATSGSGALVNYPDATFPGAVGTPEFVYSKASGTVFPLGATTVTVAATDEANNTASCSFVVTVRDTTAPTITCPANLVVEATSLNGTVVNYTEPTATDAVSTPTVAACGSSGSTFLLGVTTVTYIATDAANNSATCSFTVTVRDTTAPVISCPGDQLVEATSTAGATAGSFNTTASDVGIVSIGYSKASYTLFPFGSTTVTATASDQSGNSASCTFKVTVRDTTPPVVTCPGSKVVEATSAAGATATYSAATADDVASTTTTITYSQVSNTVFPLGATTVTATAKDQSNNTATCSFTITVRDTTAPTVSCPSTITVEATSSSGATVTYPPATVSDAVTATPTVTYSVAAGSTFPLGTTTVQVVARDEADNTRSCAFNVVVRDTTAPAMTCPADLTVEATSSAGAAVTYDPATATDAVSTPTVSYSKASDSLFPLGKTTVTATAKDSSNNTATCTFSVTVRDTTPPTVVCPADVTAEATSAAGGPATYSAASATDLVSTAAVTYSKASGTSFPLGSTTVVVIAKDAANNEASCTFKVTVRDSTAPAVTCPANVTVEATSETGAAATYTAATATDAVTASPTLSYSKVSGSVFALGTTTVTATAKDEANNESTCSFTVLVRDTTAPEIACPADVIAEATSDAGAQVTYADATATDVVSAPQISYSQASRSVFPLGETVVTASAKDAANNSSSCTFKVTVRDTTPPAFTCPVDYSVEATEAVGARVTYPAITITDLVTAAPVTVLSPATGSLLELGKTTVTVTSTDAVNNVASCSFVVSVVDTTPPDVECPNKVTVEARSATGAVVNYRDAAAADIVTSIPTLGYSTPSGSEFPVGITIVDVTATDAASNTAHCTFEVEVRDTTAPQVTCPENLTAEATSSAGATLSFESATAQDAVTAAPTITYSPEKNSTFPVGTTTVTASARDGSNNTATCTFTITVRDTTPPALVCPPDVIAEATSAAGGLAIYPDAAATDFVSASPTVTYSKESNSDFPMGASVVTVSAKDGAGNTSSCQFSVTVKDTTPPAVTCPVDVLAEATSGSGATVAFGAPVANDPVSTPVVTLSKESNTVFALGTTKVTATARDAANNTATCTFNVVVADTTPPELLCPESVVAEATSSEGALVTYTEPAATDLVGTPTVTISSPSMSAFPLGDTEVEATAVDAADNRATCTFTVSVLDTTAPVIVPPATVLVEATSADGALVDYPTVTATDLVSTATLQFTPPSGTLLPLGFTTVTVRATDAAGNASQSSFEVNVRDTTPPSVTCPARMEVRATSEAGATVGYGLPNVSDAVTARPTIHLDPESGSLFPVGETKVTATATDTAGNSGTCQFTVSVTPTESAAPATAKASGCGCSSGDASLGVLLLAAAVAGLRRRRTAAP